MKFQTLAVRGNPEGQVRCSGAGPERARLDLPSQPAFTLLLIDLPEESVGSLCLVCDVMGGHETARLLDLDLGPVCYDCFSELLNLRARLAWQAVMDGRAGD